MKKVIVSLFVLLIFFGCNNQVKEMPSEKDDIIDSVFLSGGSQEEKLSEESLASYFTKVGSTIKLKDALPDGTGLYVYFQQVNGKAKNLMLYIKYSDYNIYQFNIDGERYTYKTEKSKGRGENKEYWYDYSIRTMDMKFLRSLLHSESVRVIFSDGTSIPVTDDTKTGIKRTLEYFEILGGEFPPYM